MKKQYLTCCVEAEGDDIHAMTEQAEQVTYGTVARNCDLTQFKAMMGYGKTGLALKNDWHVGYFKSEYKGQECYYIVHSGIEYIFV